MPQSSEPRRTARRLPCDATAGLPRATTEATVAVAVAVVVTALLITTAGGGALSGAGIRSATDAVLVLGGAAVVAEVGDPVEVDTVVGVTGVVEATAVVLCSGVSGGIANVGSIKVL